MPSDIKIFLHCKECVENMPEGISSSDYAHIEVGVKSDGNVEVWCLRHDRLVCTVLTSLVYKEKMAHQGCEHPECNGRH